MIKNSIKLILILLSGFFTMCAELPSPAQVVFQKAGGGAGIHVNPASGLTTTEGGGSATFAVSLVTKPAANVTVTLSSGNTTEGQIRQTAGACATGGTAGTGSCTLTFTATDYLNAQSVSVIGQNDDFDDGNITYAISVSSASSDANYNIASSAAVSLSNTDNDSSDFVATPSTGLITKTDGSTATYQIRLSSRPSANVTFTVASDDASEGGVTSPAGGTFTFTNANWSTNQNLIMTGQAADADEPKDYKVAITGAVTSSDAGYSGVTGTILHTGLSLKNVNAASKRIFKNSTNGPGNFGGISVADNRCNTDIAKPPGTYKAVITHSTLRRACTSANCTNPGENIDWALYANTAYIRPDGTPIATTNAAGIFIFPLTNGIEPAGFTPRTGLNANWTNGNNCSDWTNSGGVGVIGSSSFTDSFAIASNTTASCAPNYNFYCAEQ